MIERLEVAMSDNRVPAADGVAGITPLITHDLEQARAKEQTIEAAHRADLTRIRDAYATHLKSAATATTDADLKKRLLAQADHAADLGAEVAQVALVAPVPATVPKISSKAFVARWVPKNIKDGSHWHVHADGTLVALIGPNYQATWKMLANGTIEVKWANKNISIFTREGKGWTGKDYKGIETTLTYALDGK